MRLRLRALVVVPVLALTIVVAGCGSTSSSSARGAGRTVEIVMTDNAYQPTTVTVAKGETVTLRFTNQGRVRHEAVLGDDAAQMAHHDEMTASTGRSEHGNMGHGTPAADGDAVTVEPGSSGSLTHTFDGAGPLTIGCHEPGHWEAGMRATVTVT